MRKYLGIFFLFLFIIVLVLKSFSIFKYTIIVDAGSSGTRLHIYRYQKFHDLFMNIFIREIYREKRQECLDNFAEQPEMVGPFLKPMLDNALKVFKVKAIQPSEVSIHVLGTAAMRQLNPDKQNAIYAEIKKYIDSHYPFSTKNSYFRSITGQNEGLFSWIDVNYLLKRFLGFRRALGMLDMGGQSTQFTVSIPATMKKNFLTKKFVINKKIYHVFSKTYLGFGLDAMRSKLSSGEQYSACYPRGYYYAGQQGHFDFDKCCNYIHDFLEHSPEMKQVPQIENGHYTTVGGFFLTLEFFHYYPYMNEKVLKQHILGICEQPWLEMKRKYPKQYKLEAQCANMMYLYDLLLHVYNLKLNQIKIVKQIGGHETSWTRGALIYVLENKI